MVMTHCFHLFSFRRISIRPKLFNYLLGVQSQSMATCLFMSGSSFEVSHGFGPAELGFA
jgi:hypothetical protein